MIFAEKSGQVTTSLESSLLGIDVVFIGPLTASSRILLNVLLGQVSVTNSI